MLPLWVFLMCKIEVLGSQGVWCSGSIEHFLLSGIVLKLNQPVSPPFSGLGCSSCLVLHFCVGVWRDTNTEPNTATLSPQGHYCHCGCSSSEYCCSASSLLRSLHDTVTEPENSFKMKLLLDVGILFHLVLCSLWVIHPLPPNHKGWGMRRLYSHKSTPFLWMNITGILWTEQPAWKWNSFEVRNLHLKQFFWCCLPASLKTVEIQADSSLYFYIWSIFHKPYKLVTRCYCRAHDCNVF